MMKTEKSKLATLGLMIFTMVFLRMNNYDYLSTIYNELDSMDIDPTFLIVSIREILSSSTWALWILLCTTVLLMINRHHLSNKIRIIEVSCSILMALLIMFIMISSVSFGRDIHLLSFMTHIFCILSLIPSPSMIVMFIQIILYSVLLFLFFHYIYIAFQHYSFIFFNTLKKPKH